MNKKRFFLLTTAFLSFIFGVNAADFYWIGGTNPYTTNQNFGNISNWSSHSGGDADMPVLPTNGDNVIFDNNSFGATTALRTVIINQNSKCDSITFVSSGPNALTINPVLAINNALEVYGSLKLKAGMTVSGASTLTLMSTRPTETLDLAGVTFNPGLTIEGTARWTVVGNLSLYYTGTITGQGDFTYKNPNSLVINGNLQAKSVAWGDGTTATRDSLTVNGNVQIYSSNTFSFTNGGVLKVTGTWSSNTTTTNGGSIIFNNSEKIEFLGTATNIYSMNFTNNTGGVTVTNGLSCSSTFTFTGNGGGVSTGTSLTSAAFTFNTSSGGLNVGTTLSTANLMFTSTNSQNITVGVSQTSSGGVLFRSDGDYTVGVPGNTGEVLRINSSLGTSSLSTYYYSSLVLEGSGTKTFNGNLWSNYYGAYISGGTVNIHGSLNLQSWYGTSTTVSYRDGSSTRILNGANVTINGNVTGGGWFRVYNTATVDITGAFTQNHLEILGGTTTIGSGPINLTGYNASYNTHSLNISDGILTFSNPQTINCVGDFTQTGGTLTLNNPKTITVGQNFSTTGGTLTGLGGSTVDVGYHWTYGGNQSITLAPAIAPILIRIHYAGLTTRSADWYNDVLFDNHSSVYTHAVNAGIYNKITVLSGQSSYYSNPVTDSLIIVSRAKHTFSGATDINKYLEIKPTTCGGAIPVEGGTINMGNPSTVVVENLQLKNQTINGPNGTYTADNSIDNGGNTNWNFTFTPKTYYWKGGAGDWDDPAHWSLDPGATRSTSPNACVPTLYDNVVFDEYSGLTGTQIIKTTSPSYCNNMTWRNITGTPTFTSTSEFPLEIYGSLEFCAGVRTSTSNYIYMVSNRSAETIKTNGITVNGNFYFVSKSGGVLCRWTLLDDFNMDNNSTMYLSCGYLNTNGKNIKAGTFDDNNLYPAIHVSSYLGGCTHGLNIANSTIELYNGWRYDRSSGVVLTADSTANSLIKITSAGSYSRGPTYPWGFTTKAGDRYHNLDFTSNSGYGDPESYAGQSVMTYWASINNGIFNKVKLLGTNTSYSVINFEKTDSLLLSQPVTNVMANIYYLYRDITIEKYLGNSRDCGMMSVFRSASTYMNTAITRTITMGSGAKVELRNMQIGGTRTSTVANFGINITGNGVPYPIDDSQVVQGTGWDTTTSGKRTWYWVGGAGNWSDLSHWAATSGGPGNAPCQVPKNPDNVIFDKNSFTAANQRVTININASCDSMIWRDPELSALKPELYINGTGSPSLRLDVYGSLFFAAGMTVRGVSDGDYSNIYFLSTRPNETFATAGVTANVLSYRFTGSTTWNIPDGINIIGSYARAYFEGATTAKYIFGGPLSVAYNATNAIQYSSGDLNLSGQTVTAVGFSGSTSNTRILNMKNATFNLTYWTYAGILSAADSEGSVINMTGAAPTFTAGRAGQVYDIINFKTTTGGTLTANAATQTYNTVTFDSYGTISASTYNPTFRRVEFKGESTDPAQIGKVTGGTYHRLIFNAGGNIYRIAADTLQFGYKNGFIYQFEASTTTSILSTINKAWYASGNTCALHTIKSTVDGTKARVSVAKAAATINYETADLDTLYIDYVYMRDIHAVTTAEAGAAGERAILMKGNQSPTSVPWGQPASHAAGNVNWILVPFAGASGFLGLGPDVSLSCAQYPYTIKTTYFLPNPQTTFEWREILPGGSLGPVLSTAPEYVINSNSGTGNFHCEVSYSPGCTLSDDIKIIDIGGNDTILWTGLGGNINYKNPANWKYPDDPKYEDYPPISLTTLNSPCVVTERYWWYLSSPYTSFNSSSFVTDVTYNKFGFYNESTASYGNPPLDGNAIFGSPYAGRGFAALLYAYPPLQSYFKGSTTYNSGTITVPVTRTRAIYHQGTNKDGFNLLGNPYGVAIDAKKFLTDAINTDVIYEHLWYRSHVGGDKRVLGWEYLCIDDGFAESVFNQRTEASLDTVAVMQAFWVRVRRSLLQGSNNIPSGSYSVRFTESMKFNPPVTGSLRAPKADPQRQAIRLNVSNGELSDQTLLIFKPNGTMGENSTDMEKMATENALFPEIFTQKTKNTPPLAICKYPTIYAGMKIPIGFRTGEAGSFSISASELNNIPNNLSVYIRDEQNNIEFDLSEGEPYSFTSNQVASTERFSLIFKLNTNVNNINRDKDAIVYVNSDNRIAARGVMGSTISVFDASGRILLRQAPTGDSWECDRLLMAGVYLVKITDANRSYTEKVVVK